MSSFGMMVFQSPPSRMSCHRHRSECRTCHLQAVLLADVDVCNDLSLNFASRLTQCESEFLYFGLSRSPYPELSIRSRGEVHEKECEVPSFQQCELLDIVPRWPQHSHGERSISRATNSNDLHGQHLRSLMQGHPLRAEPHHAVSNIALSTPNNQSTATLWRTQRSHLKTYTHLIQADRQPCSASANPSSSIASRTPTTQTWLLLQNTKPFDLLLTCRARRTSVVQSLLEVCARPGYRQRWSRSVWHDATRHYQADAMGHTIVLQCTQSVETPLVRPVPSPCKASFPRICWW